MLRKTTNIWNIFQICEDVPYMLKPQSRSCRCSVSRSVHTHLQEKQTDEKPYARQHTIINSKLISNEHQVRVISEVREFGVNLLHQKENLWQQLYTLCVCMLVIDRGHVKEVIFICRVRLSLFLCHTSR
ncbi:hypothetical protein JOB18_005198 [Solea senegalensis]|uniref:Uncharacterized protein n=1 Tax=Solea senegalensis TaxID=28829 RepID=A0AAV6SXF3_SOLSE|nr:hypothetical protein JOB18_005198 [Solea senegalensis]